MREPFEMFSDLSIQLHRSPIEMAPDMEVPRPSGAVRLFLVGVADIDLLLTMPAHHGFSPFVV